MNDYSHNEPIECALVIPVYNDHKNLLTLIRSLKNQTKPFTEIIVVDDGSEEPISLSSETSESHLKVIRTRNHGLQHARNTGIQNAESDWVTLCDSDDILINEYHEIVSEFLASPEGTAISAVYSSLTKFEDESEIQTFSIASKPRLGLKILGQREILAAFRQPTLMPTGLTISKYGMVRVGYFDPKLRGLGSEDLEFHLRVLTKLRVAISHDSLGFYRRHPKNASSDFVKQVCGEVNILSAFIKENAHFIFQKRTFDSEIQKRLIWLIGGSWARNNQEVFLESAKRLSWPNYGLKIMIQHCIMLLPEKTRNVVMRFLLRKKEKIN